MVEWRRRSGEVEERVVEERSGGAGGKKVEGAERCEERRWGGKESVSHAVSPTRASATKKPRQNW